MYWFNLIAASIISFIVSLIFVLNLENKKVSSIKFTKIKVIIYIFLNILFFINITYAEGLNKVVINLLINFFLNTILIFDFDYRKSFYYSLIFFINVCLIEVVSTSLLVLVFKFVGNNGDTLIYSVINSIFLILNSKIKPLSNLYIKIYKYINTKVLDFIFLIFATIFLILLSFNNFEIIKSNMNFYTNVIMFVFVIFVTCFIVYNINQKNQTEEKYNQMLDYVSKYEKIINEQGKRNHEFNNQLMVLEGYIDNKKKLKEYLKLLISEQKGGQNYRIKQLGYLPDGGLKGLIYYKLSKMEENNIKSFLDIGKNLKNVFKDFTAEFYSDITKIFGIFIDNAIDASLLSEEKEITIEMYKDKEYLTIVISNTFSKNEDVSKIGKKGYTSKGVGHGFGLSIVKDIKVKNDKIETFSDVENNIYKQTLLIDLK